MAKRTVTRSAKTGRFVKSTTADRSPKTTVRQKVGGSQRGARNRSAITGRFVTDATARRHPSTTVAENG